MPAGEHPYEGGRGETVVALVASGPFTTTMVAKEQVSQARPGSSTRGQSQLFSGSSKIVIATRVPIKAT